MSTDIKLGTPLEHIPDKTSSSFSLTSLRKTLKEVGFMPSLDKLKAWLQDVNVSAEELRPVRAFKPGTYARHRIFRNDYVELLVLCWRPGQRTPIHDHNGSHGAVCVLEGVMWETTFLQDLNGKLCYESARQWEIGAVAGADVPDIHQLGNPEVSGQDLVTLHLYAPPLGILNTYRIGSSEVGHYNPEEFIDGAGI